MSSKEEPTTNIAKLQAANKQLKQKNTKLIRQLLGKQQTIKNLREKNKVKSAIIKSLKRKAKPGIGQYGCAATVTAPHPGSHYSKSMIVLCVLTCGCRV